MFETPSHGKYPIILSVPTNSNFGLLRPGRKNFVAEKIQIAKISFAVLYRKLIYVGKIQSH